MKKILSSDTYGTNWKEKSTSGRRFLIWADEDTIVKVILNTYKFVKKYIDPNAPGGKEHVGYIIDRVGLQNIKGGRWMV